jgi:hypothetical protein
MNKDRRVVFSLSLGDFIGCIASAVAVGAMLYEFFSRRKG